MTNYFYACIDLLFPAVCIGCEKEGSHICKDCHEEIFAYPEVCFYCREKSSGYAICSDCKSNTSLSQIIIGFGYTGVIEKSIKAIKYQNYTRLVSILTDKLLLATGLHSLEKYNLDKETTLLTSVPMHRWKKYMQRGYNQTEKLAHSLSKKTGLKYEKLFTKKYRTRSQTNYSRDKRKQNVRGSFGLVKGLQKVETIIILDDVVTTGSTLSSLSRLLSKEFPGVRIVGLVIARH